MDNSTVSPEHLGRVMVLNEAGEGVTLSSLWEKRTAVLVFVRHFG